MNHFSCFTAKNIISLLNEISQDTHLILSKFIDLPLEFIPFIIKNCEWSKNFISMYIMSHYHNLSKFIDNLKYKNHIYYTNLIKIIDINNFYYQDSIINNYILFSQNIITEVYQKNNIKLGIL
jgi:hypothetical protein